MPKTKKITCPACGGEELELVPHDNKEGRLAAYHDCLGLLRRPVFETSADKPVTVAPQPEKPEEGE